MDDDPLKLDKFFKPQNIHSPPEFIPKFKRVLFGTFAGMVATVIVHPIDLIKVRIMTFPERLTYRTMARRVILREGMTTLFSGLNAGILRQATNTSVRLSVYNILYDRHKKKHNRDPSESEKVKIGVIAGTVGAFVGCPSEVILNRLMAQSAPKSFTNCPDLAELINKPYKGITDAINRIVMEEGVRALWRAGTHSIARSVVLSTVHIGTYEKIRDNLMRHEVTQGTNLHILTAMITSFISALFTFHLDVVKIRYQIRRYGVTKMELWNILLTKRSLKWLLTVPFPPYYSRIAIHTTVSYILVGYFNSLYYKLYKMNKRKKDGVK